MLLRTVDVDQLIDEDHSAHSIWELVGRLDLSCYHAQIESVEGRAGRGHTDPQLLISLWLCAYSRGISSARELARCFIPFLGIPKCGCRTLPTPATKSGCWGPRPSCVWRVRVFHAGGTTRRTSALQTCQSHEHGTMDSVGNGCLTQHREAHPAKNKAECGTRSLDVPGKHKKDVPPVHSLPGSPQQQPNVL